MTKYKTLIIGAGGSMKSKIKKDIKITLTLNENEARWLKGLVQNPLRDDEPDMFIVYRQRLWNALKDIKEIY